MSISRATLARSLANFCCNLRYFVRVALVSPAPDGRPRHFHRKNSMVLAHFPSKATLGLQGPPGPQKAPPKTSPRP